MIDALITSVGDPQLDRCLEAVKNQTVPFSKIIHLDKVSPQSVAFNTGMGQTTAEWVMGIGGDMILDINAVERITKYMGKNNGDKILGYYFGLYDTFLDRKIGYIGVLRGSLFRTITYEDNIVNDWEVVRRLREEGWNAVKLFYFLVGTHCDQPDEFQVFKRFYIHGIRFHDHRSAKGMLTNLLEKTGNPLYGVGIKAIEFAWVKKFYPGSHNYDFDKKNFEEFKGLN
jgi:hypothetical protein